MVVRTIAVGGAAVCIGLVAEMNPPAADALSILLPSGNGNATQINILEGNVFKPQFGAGGDGANVSNNSTLSNFILGLGNGQSTTETSGSGLFGTIVLGGATGTGNVTQVNILSYNIFNPQLSINGGNTSDNTTISNVAASNGNNSPTAVTSSGGTGMFGGAIGGGNTTQMSFFSGNIFNPQFSLFGDNTSNNLAATNVSMFNGNGSPTSVTSGGGFGNSLFGGTGSGNTNQLAIFTTNIFNPQFSLAGRNVSHNETDTNTADQNGNYSPNTVESTGGLANNTTGTVGSGSVSQTASASGNIINDQFRLGNEEVLGGLGLGGAQNQDQELLLSQQSQQSGTSQRSDGPRPVSTVVKRIKDAIDRTLGVQPDDTAVQSEPDNPDQPSGS